MNWCITIYWTLYNNTMLVYTSTTLEHISDSSCHFYMALKPFTRKRPESFGLLGHTSKWAVRVYMYLSSSSSSFLYSANGEVFPSPRAGVLHYEVKKHQYSKKLLVLIFSSYFGIWCFPWNSNFCFKGEKERMGMVYYIWKFL